MTKPLPIELWNRRLGHLNLQSICLLASGLACEISLQKNSKLLNILGLKLTCVPCLEEKQKEFINHLPQIRASRPFELIHSDICEPLLVLIGGNWYFIRFINDYTCVTWVFFLPSKSAVDVFKA